MLNLTSLTSLISPILLAAGVLVGVGVVNVQEVYIRELAVPPSFTQAGYTASIVDMRIHEYLQQLEREARTRPEQRRLATEAEKTPLQLVAEYLNLSLVARALQDASGIMEYTISGSVVRMGGDNMMRLLIHHRDGQRMMVTITRPEADIEQLLQDAAYGIMRIIDPQILCTLAMRRGLTATPRHFSEAESCIEDALATSSDADKKWLYNLQGAIAFIRGNYAAATTAFQAAVRIDPDFSPALLNLGILLAQNGRQEEAIVAYQSIFRRPTRADSPQTYAATYTEWGNSLMALGRRQEALQRYADAVRADRRYALAYFSWADALPPGREADSLRRLGEQARAANDQIYTENLVGVIRETHDEREQR